MTEHKYEYMYHWAQMLGKGQLYVHYTPKMCVYKSIKGIEIKNSLGVVYSSQKKYQRWENHMPRYTTSRLHERKMDQNHKSNIIQNRDCFTSEYNIGHEGNKFYVKKVKIYQLGTTHLLAQINFPNFTSSFQKFLFQFPLELYNACRITHILPHLIYLTSSLTVKNHVLKCSPINKFFAKVKKRETDQN